MHFNKSKPIEIVHYKERWKDEFEDHAALLRDVLTDSAIRIDHIGSTAVPQLAAKDIIDIQITIADIRNADDFISKMKASGCRVTYDTIKLSVLTSDCDRNLKSSTLEKLTGAEEYTYM